MFANACEELCKKLEFLVTLNLKELTRNWEESIHRMAMNAYEDRCTPANPRMPMVHDMEAILRLIYDYETQF